ncbi:MAG: glycoside hydrolase family 99-like domain-containing protein, partial [Planctomycetota bacterium]
MSQHESLGDLEPQARVIAFYLPQFHPMKENDEWWEPGFTEWTQVTRARPLFRGHQQPQLPSELGFYDLRVPETREQQASLARECGIEGFCYWHYWLGNGRRLLERPFEDVLSSGQPDFPFCLAWANHDWSGTAFGAGRRLLAKQLYPGFEDYLAHFKFLARAFADSRYIRVNGKPLFYIYRPHEIPDCKKVMEFFREQAEKVGHKGLYLVGETASGGKAEKYGLDAGHLSRHRQISLDDKREPSTVNRAFKKLKRLTGVGIASLA